MVDVAEEARRLDIDLPMNRATLLAAMTFLDAETSFAVVAETPEPPVRTLSRITYARTARVEDALFVFVLRVGSVAAAIRSANPGTLVDPHLGATLFIELPSLVGGRPLALRGPGIESSTRFEPDIAGEWIEARAERNIEFPMGVDILFVDESCRFAYLPRTTQISEEP